MLYAYLWLKSLVAEEEGQDLIEYVLIAGFIAIVAIAGITAAGTSIEAVWNNLAGQLALIPTIGE
jgi:Flp pilus assembly pilin Flp